MQRETWMVIERWMWRSDRGNGEEVTMLVGKGATLRRVKMCERPVGLAIADLNGDGRGELLATCTHTNKLAVTSLP